MGDSDSGMHNACSFALESPLKGCASRFTGPNCSHSAVFHEAGAGEHAVWGRQRRDRPAGIKVDVG